MEKYFLEGTCPYCNTKNTLNEIITVDGTWAFNDLFAIECTKCFNKSNRYYSLEEAWKYFIKGSREE